MEMKCLSLSVKFSCQSVKSAERSISSAVQNDATCCLYMLHKSGCSIGKREKREPVSSSRQMGSMKPSVSASDCLDHLNSSDGIFSVLTDAPPPRIGVGWVVSSVALDSWSPPRYRLISAKDRRFLCSDSNMSPFRLDIPNANRMDRPTDTADDS